MSSIQGIFYINCIKRVLITIFCILCFCPYVQLFPLETDAQPYAAFLSMLLFLLFVRRKINLYLFALLSLFIFSLFVLFASGITFYTLRSFFSYFSLFFITFTSYESLKLMKGLSYKLFASIVLVWFFTGFVQLLIYSNFLSFLIPRSNPIFTLSSGRGITCLAPEPTHYGIICLLFVIICRLNFANRISVKYIYLLLFVQVFLFSRSSTSILILILSWFLYRIYKAIVNRNILFAISLVIIVIVLNFIIPYLIDYRVGVILSNLWHNPSEFIQSDASGQERICHTFFSVYGFFENLGLPHGYDNFSSYANSLITRNNFDFSQGLYINMHSRIMSIIGGVMFELGFFSLLFVFFIFKLASALFKLERNLMFILILFFLIVFLGVGISISTPVVPFILGNMLYIKVKNNNEYTLR